MSINNLIDLVGFVGKAIIEVGEQTRVEKEFEKLKVDVATSVLKDFTSTRKNSRNVVGENWINATRAAAHKYGLTKVILLPGLDSCGKERVQICMYGGDTKSFAAN